MLLPVAIGFSIVVNFFGVRVILSLLKLFSSKTLSQKCSQKRCQKKSRSLVNEQLEMADFCDLLAHALDAGANTQNAFFDAQAAFVSEAGKKFAHRVGGQTLCGSPIVTAMRNAVLQENYTVAHDLISAMKISADMGTGLVAAARQTAQDLSEQASTTLEERAARVPILMLFPLAFFILPVVCILLTAGAVTEFLRTLLQ